MPETRPSRRAIVILPTYNEVHNVERLTTRILEEVSDAEVVVVDDASPDGTGDLVERLGRDDPRILLRRRPGKLGLGTAYLDGFRCGLERGHELLVTMDADGSHDPGHLPAILDGADGHGLVIGSRYVEGGGIENWPWHRRLLSAVANRYARALLGLELRDCTSGYRCYRREAILGSDAFEVKSSGYSFLYEMLARVVAAGFRVAESPIVFKESHAGESKISSSEIFVAMWRVLAAGLESRHGRRPGGTRPAPTPEELALGRD